MKKGKNLMDRPAILMPVSHRAGAASFGTRAAAGPPVPPSPARIPAVSGLNSSTLVILSAIAFAIPATLAGLFADEPSVHAPETPVVTGLRGSLP
jgi:hypothetical protein